MFENQSVLITGGTGSFGRKFVEVALQKCRPRRLIIFSRDELKQHEMRHRFPDSPDSPMRYFLGDVRDRERLHRAFRDVEVVVHAAALKQVPACEYNPFEAVQTNIIGAKNVIDAAIDCGVKKVMAISSDKAVNPVNLYGATKLCAEKLFVQGNSYAGSTGLRLSCCRYGNVVASRGSVVPVFLEQRKSGTLTLTDRRMTRFWLTLGQGVNFVLRCIGKMQGGEIFVPKVPSMKVKDIARLLAPGCKVNYVGIRPGEKLHEVLVSKDEAGRTLQTKDMFIIQPAFSWWGTSNWKGAKRVKDGFAYSSDKNPQWWNDRSFLELVQDSVREKAGGAGE